MKATFYFLFIGMLLGSGAHAQNLYELAENSIDGQSIQINSFAGKKVLFIILPLSKGDTVYRQVIEFDRQHGDSISIVGIAAKEEGYDDSKKQSVKEMYAESRIVITTGVYVKKAAGVNQSVLLKWLTDRTRNRHFDRDAESIGTKFFVGKTGRLYAVLGRQTSLQSPVVNQVVHAK